MAKVILKNLSKDFDLFKAVDGINLEVKDKEFVVLLGPSGCGKTTSLRLIAGLEDPTKGDIFIGERLVTHVSPKNRNIAMVFQNYALYPHKRVYDNMAFGLKLRHMPKHEIKKRVDYAAQILGIEGLLDRKPKQLSGGQKQRVALGRAIVRQPDVFLFDEPLSNLDAKLRVEMREELSKLHQRLQATGIYVTHDQVEAMTLGDRIVVMNNGQIQQVGKPMEVYNCPANKMVAGFIGSPAMNFIPGKLICENSQYYVDIKDVYLRLSQSKNSAYEKYLGKDIIIGIRPEDISDFTSTDQRRLELEKIHVRVEVFEPLGAEVILRLSLGRHDLRACVRPDFQAEVNQNITLFMNRAKIHLFDLQTGLTITQDS